MVGLQDCKFVMGLAPISSSGGAITPVAIDCLGFHYATCVLMLGVVGAAGWTAATGFLTESDDNSSWSSIITGTNFEVVDADDGALGVGFIDLSKRKRYIRLNGTAGANAVLNAVLFILSRADRCPDTATLRGATLATTGQWIV